MSRLCAEFLVVSPTTDFNVYHVNDDDDARVRRVSAKQTCKFHSMPSSQTYEWRWTAETSWTLGRCAQLVAEN